MDVAFKFVERAIDFVLEASIRQLGYIFCYKRNVEELRRCTEDLEDKRKPVHHKIQVARNNGENIFSGPENWCHEVEEKIKESKEFQDDDETHKKTGCSRSILFLWYRHKLGRKANKMAEQVKSLSNDSRQDNDVSCKQNPKSSDTALSNVGYLDVESRKNTMEEIMKQLEDPTLRMIGVHGPSGMGKTTLVKEIARKARDNNLFEVVILVDITRNPNLQKIQEEIAYHLELTFEGEGENGRADRLRMRLKQKKQKILMILDDIWDELSLNMFGISFDDDDLGHENIKDRKDFEYKMTGKEKRASDDYDDKYSPSGYKGCKILLTSRSKEVLYDKMNVKENSIFSLMELNDEEAMKLFKKAAEMPDENPNFKPEIVKYCAGLPMAILTVGKALRNESESVWEDTLKKLKKYAFMEVQNSMEISMKMSYDHLESDELKSIFLLCAQMGHQPLIMDLVKYCIGLGILKGVHTLGDARDRVSKSIQKLKKSSLLLDDNSNDNFNMHDMHRDVALSIAHKVKNVFTWRNDKLDVWPNKDELKRCTVISIYKSDIVDELPKVINCPRLRVFHIDGDYPNLNIPDRFFARMEELGVLILNGIHLLSLPSSIKCLSNLRMLCLERCDLGNLSIIKDLKKLRILSLSGSKIEDWPADLGGLSKLQLLDISDCSIGNLIPPCFISSLSSLEELYVRKSLMKMEVERETNQSQTSVFSQLKHLHELKIIDVCIPSADVLPTDLFFDKLNDYKIVIGDFMTLSMGDFKMPNKYEASRTLALQLKAGMDIHSLTGIKMLFKRVKNLLLGELNGVQNVVCELNLDGFPDLKNLSVVNNTDIEYIVNSMELSHPLDAFPKLEHLNLFNLMNIKNICCSPVTDGSFSRLKTINVKMCTKLKNLFSFNIVKFLVNLETIDASECAYLEEIVVDEGEVSDKVKFHKLCSLTVQELPSFVSFYTNNKTFSIPQYMDRQARHTDHIEIDNAKNEQSVTTYLSLFGEKVEIPNLESLNLSSIKIHKIWSDQLSSFCFQNLIKLTVDDCCNLTYLCSLSVASNLNELKGLFVSNCRMMETLFATEGDSNDYSKECIFPKLEEIQLIDMNMLKDIWPAEVSANSFPSLISVHIEKCGKLNKIFPSHMQGWHRSLDSLKVVYCESVVVIFEIRCPPQQDAFTDDTKLKIIILKVLPNLKQVWSRDPEGVVNFTNLRSINVLGCHKLSYVFPVSVAKGLAKLVDFSIQSCHEMEEIVGWVAGLETINEPLVFTEITSIRLIYLQNIKCFYKGRQIIDCPKLKQLVVIDCPELEAFTTESTTEEGRTIFSAEKVISNLEQLVIGQKEAEWLKSNTGKYRMQRMKHLCLYELPSVDILYWFLHRIPNLERLRLYSSHYSIRELVPRGNTAPRQRLGAVWQLKKLILFFSNIEDIGFERDPLLQRLERLVIYSCNSLINLAHHTVSFTQLTYLEVKNCYKLKKLMASSTAKSLVRLKTMKVMDCVELEEIVTNDDEGNEEEKVMGNIVFGKLITIELESLTKLTCFCSYKNCDFTFPLLEKMILKYCPEMKTFTRSRTRAPKLQNVLVAERKFEEGKWYWEGDLNATIQKVSVNKSRLELSTCPGLEQVWCGKELALKDTVRNLKTLVVANIGYLVHVIPSHLLPCFKNLEELQVQSCDAVQVIFNINDSTVTKAMGVFRLKKLSLRKLPRLEHVSDRGPKGIIGLQALRDLSIQECSNLKYMFPASVAKDLAMLKKLSVVDCQQLVKIFAEDTETASEEDTRSFVFRSLTSLELRRLPELKYFYPRLHNLEFPVLEQLRLQWWKWEILSCQEAEAYLDEQVLAAVEKVIFNLEYLEIGQEEAEWLKSNIGNYCMHRLKQLCLNSVQSVKILHWLLHRIPNLERLELSDDALQRLDLYSPDSSIRELVPSGNTTPRQRLGAIWQLKELTLCRSNIEDIGFERDLLLQRIERLVLRSCYRLIKLAHHAVSFTQLTYLEVSSCPKLKKLMAASTAKSLVQLTTMKVLFCRELEEIVTNNDEGNEEEKVVDNIVFGKLITIELKSLTKLTCFCSYKNCDFSFPLLAKLILKDCPKMKTFTQSRTRAPKLQNVLVAERTYEGATSSYSEEKWYWEGDLNATILKVSVDKSRLELPGYPELQQVWCSKDLVPENSFRNLKTLVVANIGYLVHVIPSHLLPCFNNLEELEVESCDAVQVIFNINDNRVTKAMGMFRFKKLSLRKLPMLEHVWDRDPEETIDLQALQDLSVKECNRLKYVFPTSVAKDFAMLKMLSVVDCVQLVEIFVEGIETALEGDTKSFVFCSLTSLELRRLPELKCFYPGLHNLEFPVLEELHLHQCKWVILSCQEAEAYLEEQVLVAVEKVNLLIHNLGKLSFDMGAATVTWDIKSKELKLEQLLNFSEQSEGVLYEFLQTVPNVEKLEVSNTYSSLKEMFSAEKPNADYAGVLSHLKQLTLKYLSKLKSVGLEHSWIHPIPENLRTLQVERCGQLKNLVPAAGTVSFSNLTDLVVSDCRNLLYLFTSSTATSLAQLERMEICNCKSMQEIVSIEGDESHESGQIIFEQLQSLSLEKLPMLGCFYSGNYTLWFPSLEKVFITDCLLMQTFCPLFTINQDLVKLFSGSGRINKCAIRWEGDINTTIRKLNEKKTAKSARELRDLKLGFKPHFQEMWCGSLPVPDACFSNLESLVVDGCEFLSEVLPSNLLPFLNKMHKLEVRNCSSVKTIFDGKCITKDKEMSMGTALLPLPFSLKTLVLEKLPNLESVWNVDSHCEGLSEIVARVEAAPEGTNLEFTFPSLTSLMLLDLPKLKCFYCSLRCVQLNRLDQDPHIEDQACAKEITPNLNNLSLGEKEMKMIWHGQCQENHLNKVKVLDLQDFNVGSNEFPFGSLHHSFKDSAGILLQLKGLKLASLSELISIGLEHPWVEESFLKELETLEATSCSRLRNLVPSSICFSSLMRLTVSKCEDMIHLFNTSTAKSLAQLKHMVISHCKTIQEIVSKEGGESHHDEIVFGQLQELNLEDLPNLESFYKGSFTLSFPALEKLSVIKCRRMDTFCAGTITASKLSGVQFRGYDTPLEVDLNFTIHKAFKAQVAEFVMKTKNMKLLDKPEIHAIWHGSFPVPLPRFINLKSLILERFEFLSSAIPSHILCLLCKLEELEVRQCHSVNTIFELKDMVKGKKKLNTGPALSPSFRLKKLTFEQLPNLEHVWDSDPQDVIGLQNLQEVHVNGCDSLERLFPASVAKSLAKLEKLEVQQCARLVEIVAEDEAVKGGPAKEFVMPCMTFVRLWCLPELKCFYPEPHKLECPNLKEVHLFHCDKLKTFTCESQSLPEAQSEYQVGIPLNPQALFLLEEVIPCLEFLAINKEMAMLIWHDQFHAKLLHKLETVQLQCFHDDSDTFPYGLLQKVPNTEKLVVSCSSFKELFSSERPTMNCAEEILSHVKCLKLSSMSKLNSIGLEHSWVDPISENLKKLQIDQCHCLRNIVPCKVSFSNLIDLNVSQCGGLVSLFTPSTSRTLSQLKNMSIENCESLEEIVSEEAEESSNDDEEQITFHKLETLSLHSLPRLGRFYGGSVALSFPSLDELTVINCCKMESFCGGAISVNVNRWTTFKFKEDQSAVLLIVDLNSATRKAFEGTPLPRSSPMIW